MHSGVKCGDRLGITKACPGIETFNVACGWRNPEEPLDLDILASAVAKDGKLLNHKVGASLRDSDAGRHVR